ncbi:hypothetical protein GCM10009557_56670 [Virgisporangium ochraceum]|uniref:Copper resistance protein D domain-containing protein n=1 Tax=Virgisporangium ochraceum TaxID=65505 RepID=A0A8J3ZW18_9ACTN|nr:hypothetical protein [Virgisporangium ochraceum]GIJ69480.1 hypothetical protein Voc01_043970 [Virgisporangium ochraceum]
MTVLLGLIHSGIGAVWLGSMVYSLGVVQPRIGRLFGDPAKAEDVYRELAAGNRWRVVAMIVFLGLSGAALILGGGDRTTTWWALIAAKVALLLAAAALFWWVSWRGWPARVFALPEELAPLQRRFRRTAIVMTALVGLAFALGVVAAHS